MKDIEDIYRSINEIHPNVLVLSEATENDETSPEKLKACFESDMVVNILPPKSEIHSSDIIRENGIRPVRLAENQIKLK